MNIPPEVTFFLPFDGTFVGVLHCEKVASTEQPLSPLDLGEALLEVFKALGL